MDTQNWLWLIGYFVVGFVVAAVMVRTSHDRDADNPLYAVVSMLAWPAAVVIAALWGLGVLIVIASGRGR